MTEYYRVAGEIIVFVASEETHEVDQSFLNRAERHSIASFWDCKGTSSLHPSSLPRTLDF